MTSAQQCGYTSDSVCLQVTVVDNGPTVWVHQSGVSVCLQESVGGGPSSLVGSAKWCQCLFAGICGVSVCLQESVMSMFVCRNQLLAVSHQSGFSKVVSVFVCRAQESVVAGVGPSAWVQQSCVSVCLLESVVSVLVCRCQHLQESVGGGPSVWVQQGGVSVCLQESVMSMFVCRNQLLAVSHQCGFSKVVSVFVGRNQ